MQSEQERIVRAFMSRTMGSPFIFVPDKIQKGPGRREPADLAWACNDCVVLFHMKSSQTKPGSKLSAGNIAQALGWLRLWQSGKRLTGKNAFQSFDIGFGEYKHLVMVSVVGGKNPHSTYHSDMHGKELSKAAGVTLWATITDESARFIAENSGSNLDLISYINAIRKSERSYAARDAMALVRGQFNASMSVAGATLPDLPVNLRRESLQYVSIVLSSIRDFATSNPSSDLFKPGSIFSALNDIPWADTISLLAAMAGAIDHITAVPPGAYGARTAWKMINGAMYQFIVSAAAMNVPFDTPFRLREKLEKERPEYPPILVHTLIGSPPMMNSIFSGNPRSGPSAVEQLLDKVRLESST